MNRYGIDHDALAQRSVDAWMEHCTAMARGVPIGLSEGLESDAGGPAKEAAARTSKR